MKKTPIPQVKNGLKKLFDIDNLKDSQVHGNRFYIHKQDIERLQCIDMLKEYFQDKVIDGGYLEVEPITFIFTTFEIKEGKP